MILEDLEYHYGPYVAEMVRQALTLEEFHRLEIEELVPYFALRAARTYDEYANHQEEVGVDYGPATSKDVYLDVLRRRWQQAEDLAQLVLNAERDAKERDERAVG